MILILLHRELFSVLFRDRFGLVEPLPYSARQTAPLLHLLKPFHVLDIPIRDSLSALRVSANVQRA